MGVLELNENPDNYFAHVEQAAFAPAHVVDGISFSPDRMLQGRILGYPDAQRYHIDANYEQIPVNRCPFPVNNYQHDGTMRVDGNGGSKPNYFPNSFDNIYTDEVYRQKAENLGQNVVADWYDRNGAGENDHYTQPDDLFRLMTVEAKQNIINNIVGAMKGITGPKKDDSINRQLCHFFRADIGLGIAQGLGVDIVQHASSMQPD